MTAKDLDPQEDAFVAAYIETSNASEAYRICNPKAKRWKAEAVHVAASRMLSRANVQLRLQDHSAKVRAKAELTSLDILNELEEARELAKKNENPAAMVAASMGKAKVAGLVIDRKEIGDVGDFKRASDAELDEFISEHLPLLSAESPSESSH